MSSVCNAVHVLQALANFSDLDDYYDVVDCLEEQGMERIMNVCYVFVSLSTLYVYVHVCLSPCLLVWCAVYIIFNLMRGQVVGQCFVQADLKCIKITGSNFTSTFPPIL